MEGLRAEDDGKDYHDKGSQLKEERLFGRLPMNDQKEKLDDGDEQAGQPPPDTFPKGGDQKPEAADYEDNQAQQQQADTNGFHPLEDVGFTFGCQWECR
jgi:hypothetical protein